MFLPFFFVSILAADFAVFAMKLNVRLSLKFVAFGFFLRKLILTIVHCAISCMLSIGPVTILRPLSVLRFAKHKVIYLLCLLRIHVPLLVFRSTRSIAEICTIILSNIHYLLSCTVIYCL